MFIKTPSAYMLKLPGPHGEWLNLALIRRAELDDRAPDLARITWENGDCQIYSGSKALAIIEALGEATAIDKSDFSHPAITEVLPY